MTAFLPAIHQNTLPATERVCVCVCVGEVSMWVAVCVWFTPDSHVTFPLLSFSSLSFFSPSLNFCQRFMLSFGFWAVWNVTAIFLCPNCQHSSRIFKKHLWTDPFKSHSEGRSQEEEDWRDEEKTRFSVWPIDGIGRPILLIMAVLNRWTPRSGHWQSNFKWPFERCAVCLFFPYSSCLNLVCLHRYR